ncbi:diaminopimelate decarboxylase [bacterium]|nr:diaminopimelate decarboxylase [bacterium]
MTVLSIHNGVAPLGVGTDESGTLTIAGLSARELVNRFDSPLYVMDEATIRHQCRLYTRTLGDVYPNHMVVFAGKSCLNLGLLNLMAEEGLGVDVVSAGELLTALKSNIPIPSIVLHGNNKSVAELDMALSHSVRIVVDHEAELHTILQLVEQRGLIARIMFRLKPEIEAHTHDFIKTGHIDSKFGIDQTDLLRLVRLIKDHPKIRFLGLHSHIGSQIFDVDPYVTLADLMATHTIRISEELGRPLDEINLGGGIGIQYVASDDPMPIPDVISRMATRLKERFDRVGYRHPKLIVEPGRSIVGTAGVTLYTVGAIKEIPGIKTYVFVDGGMADNIRPMLYQSQYTYCNASQAHQEATEPYAIAGRYCESGDVLTHRTLLAPVSVGDLIAVFGTGAYNYTMSSQYNRTARPAMVLVSHQKATPLIERESLDDLLRLDVV